MIPPLALPLFGTPSIRAARPTPVPFGHSGNLCLNVESNWKAPAPQRNEPPLAFGRRSCNSNPPFIECFPFTKETDGCKLKSFVVFWLGLRAPPLGYPLTSLARRW